MAETNNSGAKFKSIEKITDLLTNEEMLKLFEKDPEQQDEAIRSKFKAAVKNNALAKGLSVDKALASLETKSKGFSGSIDTQNQTLSLDDKMIDVSRLDLLVSKYKNDLYKYYNSPTFQQKLQEENSKNTASEIAKHHKVLKFKLKFNTDFIKSMAGGEPTQGKINIIKEEVLKQLSSQGFMKQDLMFRVPKSFNFGNNSLYNSKNENYLDFLAKSLATKFSSMDKNALKSGDSVKLNNDPTPKSKKDENPLVAGSDKLVENSSEQMEQKPSNESAKQADKDNILKTQAEKKKKMEETQSKNDVVLNFNLDDLGENTINSILRRKPEEYYSAAKESILNHLGKTNPKQMPSNAELGALATDAETKLNEKKAQMDNNFKQKFTAMNIQEELEQGFNSIKGELASTGKDGRRFLIKSMVKDVLKGKDNAFTDEEIENFRPSNNNLSITVHGQQVNITNNKNLNLLDFFTAIYLKRAEILANKRTKEDALKNMKEEDGIEFSAPDKITTEKIIDAILGVDGVDAQQLAQEEIDKKVLEEYAANGLNIGPARHDYNS